MKNPDKLYKTTIVIWTAFNPDAWEIDDLAAEAMDGMAFCSEQETKEITDKNEYPNTEFFGVDDDNAAREYNDWDDNAIVDKPFTKDGYAIERTDMAYDEDSLWHIQYLYDDGVGCDDSIDWAPLCRETLTFPTGELAREFMDHFDPKFVGDARVVLLVQATGPSK